MQRGLAMRKLSVCLSVRPCVCHFVYQTRRLWQNRRQFCPDFYTIRKIIFPSFLTKRMVGGGRLLLSEILCQTYPDFQPIFARSASAVTASEKCSINNRKSTTRFPPSLRWASYVSPKPPQRASKAQNGRFPCKIAFRLRKSATKFLCVKTVSDKVVRHSLAYLSV